MHRHSERPAAPWLEERRREIEESRSRLRTEVRSIEIRERARASPLIALEATGGRFLVSGKDDGPDRRDPGAVSTWESPLNARFPASIS